MARTAEQILVVMLGQQQVQIAALTAENEALKEKLAATEPPKG